MDVFILGKPQPMLQCSAALKFCFKTIKDSRAKGIRCHGRQRMPCGFYAPSVHLKCDRRETQKWHPKKMAMGLTHVLQEKKSGEKEWWSTWWWLTFHPSVLISFFLIAFWDWKDGVRCVKPKIIASAQIIHVVVGSSANGAKAVEASERSCSLQANSSTTTWYGTHLE